MHWVYVLKSSKTGNIYVGETTRLYRRWGQHSRGEGGINTSSDDYDTVIGLYKVSTNTTFLNYYYEMVTNCRYAYRCQLYWGEGETKQDALRLENHITKRYFYEYKNNSGWAKIRGGSYTNENSVTGFCFSPKVNEVEIDRPLCLCGYPCEVNMKKDKTKIYYTCPVPEWIEGFTTSKKCSFWKEFENYRLILDTYIPPQSAIDIFGDD